MCVCVFGLLGVWWFLYVVGSIRRRQLFGACLFAFVLAQRLGDIKFVAILMWLNFKNPKGSD